MALGLGALLIASISSALISAGISAYNNNKNIDAQKEANQQNIDMQNGANAQNIELSNTAHQREMADLEAAGLNPVLTATGGNGAASGFISSPSVKPVNSDLSGVSSAVSSAMNSLTMLMMAKSMANTNAALLATREGAKNSRLQQVLAARQANNNAAFSAKDHKAPKEAIKKIIDEDDLDWSFMEGL